MAEEWTRTMPCAGIGFGCGKPVKIPAVTGSDVFMAQCAECLAMQRRLRAAEYGEHNDHD